MSGVTSAVPPFQKVLMNFLDNYAPVVGECIFCNVWFQKISIPPLQRVILGISEEEEEGLKGQNF